MRRFTTYLVIALISSLLYLPGSVSAKGGITYSGSSTVGTGVLKAGAVEAFENNTGIKFTLIDQRGSGKGIAQLIAGKADLAGASRPLKAKEKREKILGHTIGYDAIAVFVHKSNPVNNLTKQQLKGIFTGEIKNWKEVVGNDAPITPNTEIIGEKRATLLEFQKRAMDGASYGREFKEINLPKDQIVYLADDKTGIATVSLGLLSAVRSSIRSKVKIISVNSVEPNHKSIKSGSYLISRPLLLVTRGVPKGQVKKFINFMLSNEGQTFVAKNFVSVKGNL
jgi:phosphate transport system substrate-binding protein